MKALIIDVKIKISDIFNKTLDKMLQKKLLQKLKVFYFFFVNERIRFMNEEINDYITKS